MNMPDYSMIYPAGMGELRRWGPQMPISSGIQSMYDMIPKSSPDGGIVGRGLDRAGELGSELAEKASGFGQGISQGISEADRLLTEDLSRSVAPMRDFDVAATQRISDVYDKAGAGAGIGQFFREIPGAFGAVGSSVMQGIQGLSDLPVVYEPARALQQTFTGSVPEDPTASFLDVTLGDIFGGKDEDSVQVQGKTGAEVQPAPAASQKSTFDFFDSPFPEAVQDPKGQPDAITRTIGEVIETQSEGESPARASYNSAIASIDQLISDLKNKETQESPALDLSDIIDRSKRMTEANVLMQLGSGILAGDTAKGIQRASEAGLAGTQQVANLEMKERIAKTQAGREDIRRGEQRDLDIAKLGIQKGQLEMMDTRLANELNKAERVQGSVVQLGL